MKITHDELIRIFDFDESRGILINKVDRCSGVGGRVAKAGDRPGSLNNKGYWQISVNGRCYVEHRLILLYLHGKFPIDQLDHVDGNRLNNKAENLRECTQRENDQNRGKSSKKRSSKFVGVCFDNTRNMWCASLHFNGKHQIKFFETEELAKQHRAELKKAHHAFNPFDREAA